MTIRFLDFEGGNDSNDGSTFALRKKTLTSASSGLGAGDTVRVMASAAATNMGINAAFTNGSDTVSLASAVTATISNCETAWTPSANVTSTAQTTFMREGTNAARNDIAASFTTGLVAYTSFAAKDLSGYQQISFLFYSGQAVAANVLQLKLCSDSAGATPVNTINIPAIPAGYWTPVTVDTGGALGSSIQSVALYAASDPGTINTVIDNILACKAPSAPDSLTHMSFIGKGTNEDTEPWLAIESINDTTVRLWSTVANTAAKSTTYFQKYQGTTETVACYKREPIVFSAAQVVSGSSNNRDNPFVVDGGYNRTDMSTKTGRTYVRAGNPSANCISCSFNSSVLVKSFGLHSAGAYGLQYFQGDNDQTDDLCIIGGYTGINSHQSSIPSLVLRYSAGCQQVWYLSGGWSYGGVGYALLKADFAHGTANAIITGSVVNDSSSAGELCLECASIKNFGYGVFSNSASSRWTVRNTVFSNLFRDMQVSGTVHYFNVTPSAAGIPGPASIGEKFFYTRLNGDKAQNGVWTSVAAWATATDQRHTASGVAWKVSTTTTCYAYSPVSLTVAKVACKASEARTVSLWFRRDNTSLLLRLRAVGGRGIPGLPADVVSNMTAAANTWEQLSVNFTPTEDGVVEIVAEAYGGGSSLNGWVDDLSVS